MEKRREDWLDCSRGLAMAFVLLGHAGVSIPGISRFALLFYVPVFFVAAGYVYRKREESFGQFAARRAKRLLLPYFGYSFFLYGFYLVKELAGGRLSGQALRNLFGIFYARNSLYPPGEGPGALLMTAWNSPLWFLPALFLSEICFAGLCRWSGESGGRRMGGGLACLCAGTFLNRLAPFLLPWSVDSILLFMILLWAGQEARLHFAGRTEYCACLLPAAVCCAVWNGSVNVSVGRFGDSVLIGVAGMACASLSVMGICALAERLAMRGSRGPGMGAGAKAFMEERLAVRSSRGPGKRIAGILTAAGRNTLPVMGLHLFVFMWVQGAAGLVFPEIAAGQGAAGICFRAAMALGTLLLITAMADMRRSGGIIRKTG